MQHILCFILWKSLSGGVYKSLLSSLCTLNRDTQNNCGVVGLGRAWGNPGLRMVCCWLSPKMSTSQSVPVGLRARGQSLALSVFSSIDIVGDRTQRQSLQNGVQWSCNKFTELQKNWWVHWPYSSDHNHCFMAKNLPVSTLNLSVVSF